MKMKGRKIGRIKGTMLGDGTLPLYIRRTEDIRVNAVVRAELELGDIEHLFPMSRTMRQVRRKLSEYHSRENYNRDD